MEVKRPCFGHDELPAVAIGAKNGCPICRARELVQPLEGTDIRLLNGSRAGRKCSVLDPGISGQEQIAVRFDGESPTVHRIVRLRRSLFVSEPIDAFPGWLLPFFSDDALVIDEHLVRLYQSSCAAGRWRFLPQDLMPLVYAVWHRRLPVRGSELWETLRMHGFPEGLLIAITEQFSFGIDLLNLSHGRSPVKRRRISGFKIGRYEPKRRQRHA